MWLIVEPLIIVTTNAKNSANNNFCPEVIFFLHRYALFEKKTQQKSCELFAYVSFKIHSIG